LAESTPVADQVTNAPTPADLERAEKFTREPFVSEGEDAATALAPGTPRRAALDAALAEVDAGLPVPSVEWRRRFSLLLGLERLLGEEEPRLVDGTVLSAHQVDALSGTLTALLAETQRNGNGQANGTVAAENIAALAPVGIPGEEDEEEEEDEEPQDWSPEAEDEDVQLEEQPEDPNAAKRFWFEHATGAGKTVAALGFVEASRTGGVLILTHRRNLVDQFHGELRDRGYAKRISPALLGDKDPGNGPVTVETYQWFVRNAGKISDAYTIVICDEAHTALGEKTSGSIRQWGGPIFVGMTATGALIARHVTDLFPTQTSRFDLAQAARRGVIAPLRCVRIPPGPGVRTIAKVPLRRGEVDTEFDQEMLAELLDQLPFNLAVADLYKTRFNGVPGVVYAAGVRHAYNVAEAFRDVGLKAQAVSGETPKRELAEILARYERGDVDVLVNAQLLAEGWNSPRATVCMHLAPTASKRIYQQRVGRVTRRQPGKESGIVVDFVHPATKHDDPVVTLHSLLDRDVYRGGAIVVGPVRRGRGRRLRVERRVLPVTADENRRIEVFERELWRIAVEHLDYGEQVQWAALAGARVAPTGWRRARAMLHFDHGGELKRTFLLTAVERNKNPQLRLRALQEIAASKDAEAFDRALDFVEGWPRDDKREGVKVVLQALAEKKIGRRDQANNWIWRCANLTREVHEEYAVQRWPETKRLLGLLVNSSGGAHARNARRLVHAARQQDRRLSAALLAAALPHTAEAGEVINGARTRMSRKPAALARELLRNFPKGKGKRSSRRRRKKGAPEGAAAEAVAAAATEEALTTVEATHEEAPKPKRTRSRRRAKDVDPDTIEVAPVEEPAVEEEPPTKPARKRAPAKKKVAEPEAAEAAEAEAPAKPAPRKRAPAKKKVAEAEAAEAAQADAPAKPAPRKRAPRKKPAEPEVAEAATAEAEAPAKPARKRAPRKKPAETAEAEAPKKAAPRKRATAKKKPAEDKPAAPRRRTTKKAPLSPLEAASERVRAAVEGDEAA
jgi:superfamily II DNA or RNA helicase